MSWLGHSPKTRASYLCILIYKLYEGKDAALINTGYPLYSKPFTRTGHGEASFKWYDYSFAHANNAIRMLC
jgi:hypothetical protein